MSGYWYGKTKIRLYRFEPPSPHPFERIDHERVSPPLAKARVYKVGPTWHFQTALGTKVVDSDNTNHWRSMFDAAFLSAAAFDHVLRIGHPIKRSYRELVDRAPQP